jgi:hypothetical protein
MPYSIPASRPTGQKDEIIVLGSPFIIALWVILPVEPSSIEDIILPMSSYFISPFLKLFCSITPSLLTSHCHWYSSELNLSNSALKYLL